VCGSRVAGGRSGRTRARGVSSALATGSTLASPAGSSPATTEEKTMKKLLMLVAGVALLAPLTALSASSPRSGELQRSARTTRAPQDRSARSRPRTSTPSGRARESSMPRRPALRLLASWTATSSSTAPATTPPTDMSSSISRPTPASSRSRAGPASSPTSGPDRSLSCAPASPTAPGTARTASVRAIDRGPARPDRKKKGPAWRALCSSGGRI
jgi:hypothetical protein